MDKIISCEFNIDTACVEVKYADGSMISIDCTRVENESISLNQSPGAYFPTLSHITKPRKASGNSKNGKQCKKRNRRKERMVKK